jgi:tetratricopeptide (TPR) repeat protein
MNHKLLLGQAFSDGLRVDDFNRALKYIDKRKYDKALALLKKVKNQKEFKEVWLNMGVAYKGLGNYEMVRDCFLKAVEPTMPLSDGSYVEQYNIGLSNLGLLAYAFEHDDTAEKFYHMVLADDPLNYDAIWNLSIVSLRKYCSHKNTDLKKCWDYYTYRFKRKNPGVLKNDKPGLISWDLKTSYPDKSIVILLEQGMGDAMMFGRYLAEVAKHFKKVYVQCTPEMDCVFQDFNTCYSVADTDVEYAIPMASLGKMIDYIPEGDWLSKHRIIKEPNGVLDIGVVWAGNPEHSNDANRSIPAYYFDRLKKYGNLHTIGPNPRRAGYTHLHGISWKDTIDNLGKLDLVISIDSSIVHMCGSLGMPCWLLQPKLDTDFRWGDSSMGWDNIWYRSVDVFRNPNDWNTVFNNVEKRLENAISEG